MFFPEKLTIQWIKSSYDAKVLTPVQLIEEIIKRAEAEKEKNIWIVPPTMDKIKSFLDHLPEKKGSLWGIPFAVKDNIDVFGFPTTAGCPEYSYIPTKHSTVVGRLVEAGAIPIGKTNMDQFATGLVGTRSPYGVTCNSYQQELISGGSSSGSAVSVALGMAAFSLGTDTAGSGRVPAALNSLVGYKPSVGAWSIKGVVPAAPSIDCVNSFTNNLEDAFFVNEIVKNENDLYEKTLCEKTIPKRILLPRNKPTFFGKWAKIYEEKWEKSIDRIKRLGVEIGYIDTELFDEAAKLLYEGSFIAERWASLGDFVEANPGKILPVTETVLRTGVEKTAANLFKEMNRLKQIKILVWELLQDRVLIMPTVGGTFTREDVEKNPIDTNSLMGSYTNHCNLLDLCAIALPENQNDRIYPFGITAFGISGKENLLHGFAHMFMQSKLCLLAVCGLHKKDYPLESQLVELGARFVEHTKTAEKYGLYSLPMRPKRPGMVRRTEGGSAIEVDIFEIEWVKLGVFMEKILSPLVIGNVELADGRVVKGFLCEEYGVIGAEDITEAGSFR